MKMPNSIFPPGCRSTPAFLPLGRTRALPVPSRKIHMVTALFGDSRVSEFKEATAALTAPGQHYEVREDDVLGERLPVFVNRPRSLREVLLDATTHGDRDAYVFDDGRRISFVEIERHAA